jgi:hypothetical protein
VLSIARPGSTATASISVSSTVGLTGNLQVLSINTSDRTNWLCAQPAVGTLTVSIGTGCTGITSTQLLNSQIYTGQIGIAAPTVNGTLTGTLNITLQVGSLAPAVVTLNFTNKLLYPVNALANGAAIGVINASSTMAKTVPSSSTLSVSFSMIQPTVGGLPLGEPMAGIYTTIQNPSGTYNFTINNVIGNQTYFAPLLKNSITASALMEVNAGLTAEKKCFCVVPAAASDVAFGYYSLYTNSSVRAFKDGSNYSGHYEFWGYDAVFAPNGRIDSLVESGTGILRLNLSVAP